MTQLVAAIGVVAAVFIIGIPLAFYGAWVYSPLWGWFIEPYLHMPLPSLWTLAAWLMIVRIPFAGVSTYDPEQKTMTDKFAKGIVVALIGPPLVLFSGYIYHSFGG